MGKVKQPQIEPRILIEGKSQILFRQPAWSEHEGNMMETNKTPIEILKNELVKLLWGIVAAAFVFLIFWFIAMPLLKKQIQSVGGGSSATSSQVINDNKAAK